MILIEIVNYHNLLDPPAGMLWKIDGRLTAQNYINILDNVMLPSVREVFPENFTFQHVRNEYDIHVNFC